MALEIYFPNTGQGDCTFILFPNGKNMLIDFNKTDIDVNIIDLLNEKIKKKKHSDIDKTCRRINYFVNTHPHDDHIKGIESLNNDDFYIDEIWETDHRLYVPADKKSEYKNYYDFLDLVNKLKKRNSVKVKKAGRTPTNIGNTEIYCFAPSQSVVNSSSREEIHNQCMIMKIEYQGNSILFAGDSNRESWEDRIVPHYSDEKFKDGKRLENLLDSTVLHASHHGSKYFFTKQNDDDNRYKTGIEKINPDYTIVSVGENNKHNHPHRIAMNIYKDNTKYERVYTTKDNKSMYFAFNPDASLTFKKDLSFNQLKDASIKSVTDSIKSTSLTFTVDNDVDLELPKRPPTAKKEGYR